MAYSVEDKIKLLKYHSINLDRIDSLSDDDFENLASRAGGEVPDVYVSPSEIYQVTGGQAEPEPEPEPEPEQAPQGYSVDSVKGQLEARYSPAGNRVMSWLRGQEGGRFILDQLNRFGGDEQRAFKAMSSAMSNLFPEAKLIEEIEKLPQEQSDAIRSYASSRPSLLSDPSSAEKINSDITGFAEAIAGGDQSVNKFFNPEADTSAPVQPTQTVSEQQLEAEMKQVWQSSMDAYGDSGVAFNAANSYRAKRESGMSMQDAMNAVGKEYEGAGLVQQPPIQPTQPEPTQPTQPEPPVQNPPTQPPTQQQPNQTDAQSAFDSGGFQSYLDYINRFQKEQQALQDEKQPPVQQPPAQGQPTQEGAQGAFDNGGFQSFLDYVNSFKQGDGQSGGQQPKAPTPQPGGDAQTPSPGPEVTGGEIDWDTMDFTKASENLKQAQPVTALADSGYSSFDSFIEGIDPSKSRPDFNLDEAISASDSEIDLLYSESAKNLVRQFNLTPGGQNQGGAIDKFEELNASANQQKLQNRNRLREIKLATDMEMWKFDTQTLQMAQQFAKTHGLDEAKFKENMRQFNTQMAQSMVEYAGNLGLSQKQFDEAVRQYNDQATFRNKEYDETVRQYNEELKYRYTEMYGGTPSVSYSQSDWESSFGKTRGEAGYKPSFDIDGDGVINMTDFAKVASNSKEISPGVFQYVPEGPRTLSAQRLDFDIANTAGQLGLQRDQLEFAKETTKEALVEEKRQYNSTLTGFLYNDDGTIQTQPGNKTEYVDYEIIEGGVTYQGKVPIMMSVDEKVASVQRDSFVQGLREQNTRMNFNLNTFLKNAGMTSKDIEDLDPYSLLGIASTVTSIQYGGSAAGQSAAGYGQQPAGEGFDWLGWATLVAQAGGVNVLSGLFPSGSGKGKPKNTQTDGFIDSPFSGITVPNIA